MAGSGFTWWKIVEGKVIHGLLHLRNITPASHSRLDPSHSGGYGGTFEMAGFRRFFGWPALGDKSVRPGLGG
jgi:hypothetical protein